jgi:hypothetical protein
MQLSNREKVLCAECLYLEQALKGKVWVNIVDLVDHRRTEAEGNVECHETEEALREYTRETKKIFPKEAAKKNKFLAALLITLWALVIDTILHVGHNFVHDYYTGLWVVWGGVKSAFIQLLWKEPDFEYSFVA